MRRLEQPAPPVPRLDWWALALVVGTAAFLARLLPVLRSGGLVSVDQYDAAIYFGSAVALLHGELPYRDFLLLHPPGSTVALLPFAALGQRIGDSDAWAVARLAMMALGALTAVLVSRVLRPLGLLPALLGGLTYAVFLPAVTIEVTTRLEPIAAPCLVGALALLSAASPRTELRARAAVLAGALLGFAATVKIWGALPLLLVAVYLLVVAGVRRVAWFTLGAAVAGTAVCLPFLLAAPEAMWRQVVLDQLDREEANRSDLERLAEMTGLGALYDRLDAAALPWVVAALVVLGMAAALALRFAEARLAVVLLVAFGVLLLVTPTWFPHYPGVWAGVVAITLGAGAAAVLKVFRFVAWRLLVASVALAVLAGAAVQLSEVEFGERFPGRRMAAAVAPLPGCITADDPGALIGMDVLSRNLDRDCPVVLDLGGYTYDFDPRITRRQRDPRWQRFFLRYLASGTATMKIRYSRRFGLTRDSARAVRRWPVIYEAEGFELRRPRR